MLKPSSWLNKTSFKKNGGVLTTTIEIPTDLDGRQQWINYHLMLAAEALTRELTRPPGRVPRQRQPEPAPPPPMAEPVVTSPTTKPPVGRHRLEVGRHRLEVGRHRLDVQPNPKRRMLVALGVGSLAATVAALYPLRISWSETWNTVSDFFQQIVQQY